MSKDYKDYKDYNAKAQVNMVPTACEVARDIPAIQLVLKELDEVVEELSQQVARNAERIAPICAPRSPTELNGRVLEQKTAFEVPLANHIKSIVHQIASSVDTLRSATNSVEL